MGFNALNSIVLQRIYEWYTFICMSMILYVELNSTYTDELNSPSYLPSSVHHRGHH